MKIKICKTFEIANNEWEEIVAGFSNSFNRESDINRKKKFYSNNIFGFSYHALALSEDRKVVAHTTVIPYLYIIEGKEQKLGLSSGTFINKEYRNNAFLFQEMYDALRKVCNDDLVIAILGVPNQNSFKYSIKVLKKRHLGYLNYYVLPIRISNILKKRYLKFFDLFTLIFFWCYRHFLIILTGVNNYDENQALYYLKKDDKFLNLRFNSDYHKYLSENKIKGIFKIENEKDFTIAYVFEFYNNNSSDIKSLWRLINFIAKNYKVDAIVFIGILKFTPTYLIKIPFKNQPKNFPLTLDLLPCGIDQIDYDKFIQMTNWKFTLTNFDVK